MSSAPPPGWPATVVHITTPVSSPKLPPHLVKLYCAPCDPSSYPNPPPRIAIKAISDPKHPACGQSGLFNVGKAIPRGTWISDYLGVVHTAAETDPTSDYDLSLERTLDEVVGCDATKSGNISRFYNDYRGTGLARPNAVFELRSWDVKDGQGKMLGQGRRMAVWAGPQGVDKGSEICVSYGRSFWTERAKEEAD